MHSGLNVPPLPEEPAPDRKKFVALVGVPNSGKTTLYNHLTGSRHRVVNYPGATVEFCVGNSREDLGPQFTVLDTPGTYSVFPKTPEEEVTRDVLFRHPEWGSAHTVVVVVDATQLSRHLLLVRQLQGAGFHMVVAVTMIDLLRKQGLEFDPVRLSESLECTVVVINGFTGDGVDRLADAIHSALEKPSPLPIVPAAWSGEHQEKTLKDIRDVANLSVQRKGLKPIGRFEPSALSRSIDRVLLHPVFGLLIFFLVMAGVFTSIFWLAVPLMNGIDRAFSILAHFVGSLAPGSLWADFLGNGMIASVGAVLVFVPQVAILFLAITLLEDSGYLARAASLVDKPLSMLGLNGRSFVPMLSAHACAIPAMLAARTIPGRKERWLTLFIIPLMSCSARLPVYALLLAFLFQGAAPWKPGVALAVIYFAALLLGGLLATVVNRFLRGTEKSFFMLELPWYRRPHLRTVLNTVRLKTGSYLRQAGPFILLFAVIVWFMTTFPDYKAVDQNMRLRHSYAAGIGQVFEPVMEPMGGDWRVGVGLISAFAARETFVSALAVVMNVTDGKKSSSLQASLLNKMREARAPDGLPLFTFASVIGLIVFFMVALQCMATVGVARREFGNWRTPLIQLFVFTLSAYILSVSVVQGLRFFGIQ